MLIKNFLLLNVLSIAIVWAVTRHVPKQLFLTVVTDGPVTMVSDWNRSFSVTSAASIEKRIFVPVDWSTDKFSFRKRDGRGVIKSASARLVQSFGVEKRWSSQCVHYSTDGIVLSLEDSAIGLEKGFILYFGIGELLLLVLSLILLFIWRRVNPSARRFVDNSALRSDFQISITCSVVLLNVFVQTAIGNWDLLDLSVKTMACQLSVIFVMILATLFAIIRIGRRCSGDFFGVLLLSMSAYIYLEAGVLTYDFPALNGEQDYFLSKLRRILDTIVMFFVVLTPLVVWAGIAVRNKSLKRQGWCILFSLILLVMSVASVFDAKKAVDKQFSSDYIGALSPIEDVMTSVVHSPRKNVALYILDSVATPQLLSVLEDHPSWQSELEGFVCFSNNLGMCCYTLPATGGLATGRLYDDPNKQGDCAFELFNSASFVKRYYDLGYDLFVCSGAFPYGITTRDMHENDRSRLRQNSIKGGVETRMKGHLPWNLLEVVRLRMAPFILKAKVHGLTIDGWPVSEYVTSENLMYPIIAEAPIDPTCRGTLQYWHSNGNHAPYGVDRFGNVSSSISYGYSGMFEKTWYVFSKVAELFRKLKRRGVYDNTFIVLMADHGSAPLSDRNEEWMKFEKGMELSDTNWVPPRAQPFLMVKPIGARSPLHFSADPTSHSKVYDLIVSVLTNNLDEVEVSKILYTKERVYRADDGSDLLDCVVRDKGPVLYRRTAGQNGNPLPALDPGRGYSLVPKFNAPCIIKGAAYFEDSAPRVCRASWPVTIKFKVPSEMLKGCDVELEIKPRWNFGSHRKYSEFVTITDCISQHKVFVSAEEVVHRPMFRRIGVVPNQKGVVELRFESYYDMELRSIRLVE